MLGQAPAAARACAPQRSVFLVLRPFEFTPALPSSQALFPTFPVELVLLHRCFQWPRGSGKFRTVPIPSSSHGALEPGIPAEPPLGLQVPGFCSFTPKLKLFPVSSNSLLPTSMALKPGGEWSTVLSHLVLGMVSLQGAVSSAQVSNPTPTH